jgi:GMP synthase (glutamine-hydrolysing)
MKLLILKTGSTIPEIRERRGDFEDWFRRGLGLDADAAPAVSPYLGEPLPVPADVPALVITGSPHMVTEATPWMLACERLVAELVPRGVPVLGVCFGHQLMARALGGRVEHNRKGQEIGTTAVELTPAGRREPLFDGLPTHLDVHSSHAQSVVELPPQARLLAHNAHDAHQAFAIGERAFGLQFHPEFDADIVRGYATSRSSRLRAEGIDAAVVAAAARDHPWGPRILRNFLSLLG